MAGYGVDLALRWGRRSAVMTEEARGEEEISLHACCDHHLSERTAGWRLLTHPLIHTAKVFSFIFLVTLTLNYLIAGVGQDNLSRFLLQRSALQPVLTALIGLIPNCAASVVITQLFLKGALSFGSVIAGLCSSAGLGLLVLARENDRADTLRIVGLLLAISIAVGLILQYASG